MLKIFLLSFNLLGLFLCRLFFPSPVSVTQTAPASVEVNNAFLVQVSIDRGNVYNMAKFTEQLPKGFTAFAVDKDGAKASFDKNTIVFSWDSLPLESTINISFRVMVGPSALIGTDTLAGKFLYTMKNQKVEADGVPCIITIKKSTAKDSIATKSPAVQKMDSVKQKPAGGVVVMRRLSSSSIAPDSSAIITLTIHKGNVVGFAKIEDSLPNGFKAKPVEAGKASFTFSDNMVKFVWQNIPSDSVISVSYRIKANSKVSGMYAIGGDFSYISNHLPAFYSIARNNFSSVASPANTASPAKNVVRNNKPDSTSAKAVAITPSIPVPQTGVNYRVQIMALHTPVDASYFASQMKISSPINSEPSGGFTKYTVGNYPDYKSVRDAREDIKNKGVNGPFVVAYNSGVRITVQEALMITHQQWYK